MRDGRALGLIATEPRRGADAGGTDPAEVVERVGSAAASQSEWDSLRQLFQSARRYPLLTAQQEKALARRYQLGERARRTLADATEPRPAIRAELKAQVKDGQRAKDTFICCNLRLVASVARLHRGQGVDLADLVQEGILGLIRAVEKFDHTLDYKLSTYATWWIRQAMARAIANTGRTIRLPVHIHELVRKILATERRLWWELEREPTIADIAGRLKEDPAHVAFVKQAAAGIVSLDARVRDDDEGAELIELMAGAEPSVEAQVMAVAEKEAMSQLLETLTERERRVLEMRYGLLDDERQTLEAVGTTFNVTRERIRQIETGALKKLKTTMERQGLAPAPPTLEDEPMPDPLADVPPLVRTATDALTTEPDLAELAIESPEDQ
jgi:RNA polymerase primary sigma factor